MLIGNINSNSGIITFIKITIRFLIPEKPIHSSSSFDSRDQHDDQIKAKVMFSYTAEKDDEITIKKGGIVDVITMETGKDGWWFVRYGNEEGFAPSRLLSMTTSALLSLTTDIKGTL